jgi:ELWxxDGT repeat protein
MQQSVTLSLAAPAAPLRRIAACAAVAAACLQSAPASAGTPQAVFWSDADTSLSQGEVWSTDGTAAGTIELKPAGGNANGLLFPLGPGPGFFNVNGEIYFAGINTANQQGLWVTNGTSAGTKQIPVAGASQYGVLSLGYNGIPDFTVLGSTILFEGADAATGYFNLWTTKGTTATTTELKVKGASSTGLFRFGYLANLTPFGKRAVFNATDTNGAEGLWITDGTAAGTVELKVAGASTDGLLNGTYVSSPDFTVLGAKLLMQGADTNDFAGLWVSNGTDPGTTNIKIAGANTVCGIFCSNAPYLTVLGSHVIFAGVDTKRNENIWITDGTSAGTKELIVPKAYGGGLLGSESNNPIVPPTFFAFQGKALFVGENTFGQVGLWSTDGTAAGTTEIVVKGANAAGLFSDTSHIGPSFASLGKQVLFVGEDTHGYYNLWVTDGTAAGTHELLVPGGEQAGLVNWVAGAYTSLFTLTGTNLLFPGINKNGYYGLWSTNGTVAGTKELRQLDVAYLTALGKTAAKLRPR